MKNLIKLTREKGIELPKVIEILNKYSYRIIYKEFVWRNRNLNNIYQRAKDLTERYFKMYCPKNHTTKKEDKLKWITKQTHQT